MRITTGKGDKGFTGLLYGARVRKDDMRIECCGALDELSAFLGLAKSAMKKKYYRGIIERMQYDIMAICSEIASGPGRVNRLKRRIGLKDAALLESSIKRLEKKTGGSKGRFQLGGRDRVSAILDICRTVSRRAERRLCGLYARRLIKNRDILIYINRVSDLLFLMSQVNPVRKNGAFTPPFL